MAYAPIALTLPQYDSILYAGWWMKAYDQGTTTPLSMATDAAAGTLLVKCLLDSQGFPITTATGPRFIPFISGDYDLWLFPTEGEADGNITANAIQLADNLNAGLSSSAAFSTVSYAVAGGTVDIITATLSPAITAYSNGLQVNVRASGVNTSTTPTLNVNGVGAKTITKIGNQTLRAGDIPRADYECTFRYNSTNDVFELLNPAVYSFVSTETGVTNYDYPVGDPRRHGCVADGTTDDYTNFWNCVLSCVATGSPLRLNGLTYRLNSTLALTSSHDGLVVVGDGGTLKRGASVTMGTITAGSDIVFKDVIFDGQYGTYTGKGFVYSGAANFPAFLSCKFDGFSDTHIEFGSDAGKYGNISNTRFILGTAQAEIPFITTTATDTTAMFRKVDNCDLQGSIDLVGAFDTFISNTSLTKVTIDANCSIVQISNGIWGNAGGAVTINGDSVHITNTRMAAAVTLAAGSTGAWMGNIFTSGGLTDSSTVGNWILFSKDLGAGSYYISKHRFNTQGTATKEVQMHYFGTSGDADATMQVGVSSTVLRVSTPLTAARTITLSTTDAIGGTIFKIMRTAASTGAFNLVIGSTGKNLATGEWVEVVYNGVSAWEITSFGSL